MRIYSHLRIRYIDSELGKAKCNEQQYDFVAFHGTQYFTLLDRNFTFDGLVENYGGYGSKDACIEVQLAPTKVSIICRKYKCVKPKLDMIVQAEFCDGNNPHYSLRMTLEREVQNTILYEELTFTRIDQTQLNFKSNSNYDIIERKTEFSRFNYAHLESRGGGKVCIKGLFLKIGRQKQIDVLNHKRTDFSQTTLRNLNVGSWIGELGDN